METSSVISQLGIPVIEDGNHNWSSQYFWDFLTKPERPEETRVQDEIHMRRIDNFQVSEVGYEETRVEDNANTHFVNDIEMNAYYGNDFEVPDDPKDTEINVHHDNGYEVSDDPKVNLDIEMNAYHIQVPDDDLKVNNDHGIRQKYDPFVSATDHKNLPMMKEFIESHPEALTLKLFPRGRMALHCASRYMDVEMIRYLVSEMEADDLEIVDQDGHTALALAANSHHSQVEELLGLMLEKNPELSEVGLPHTLPIRVAAESGAKKATRLLMRYIGVKILMKEYDLVGVRVLRNCIHYKLFDVAMFLVGTKPTFLLTRDAYPIRTLAEALSDHPTGTIGNNKSHSGDSLFGCFRPPPGDEAIFEEAINHEEVEQAREFLKLICEVVSKYTNQQLKSVVHNAMISAARNGTVDFIDPMLEANENLFMAKDDQGKGLFLHAIEHRQEEVFCRIYSYKKDTDLLLEMPTTEDGGNVLHLVAKYDSHANGGPISSFLQMQREIQWFKGVAKLAKAQYRFDPNNDGVMPNDVFIDSHQHLVDVGMKSMKDLATAASVVGGLILTVMFAALFTAPGGNDQTTGFPVFVSEPSFKFFVAFDALSLFSAATSVLLFLGILTSRYSAKDFELRLPRKLLNGFATLFFSITTMMLSFCTALIIMFDGQLLFVAPIVLLSIVPIVFFSRSVCPLLHEIYVCTYRPSVFEEKHKKMARDRKGREDMPYLPEEEEEDMSYSYTVDKMV